MVVVAQLVRASVCGTEGRGFEPRLPPRNTKLRGNSRLFLWIKIRLMTQKSMTTFADLIKMN